MPLVKEKQRRSEEEESWRQTSRYLRVKTPLHLLVKIREDALRMLLYLANIFIFSLDQHLCFVICCTGKMRPCQDVDKFVQVLFA